LYLRDPDIFSRTDLSAVGYFWALSAGFAVLAFYAFKIHDNMTPHFSVHEAIDIFEAVLFIELLTFISLFTINHFDGIPRSIPLAHGVLLAAALFAARIFIRIVRGEDEGQPTYQCNAERMIVIGANPVAGLFIRLLSAYAPQRQHVIALLDPDAAMIGRAIAGVQVVGSPQDLEALIKEYAIHGISVSRVVIAGEADLLTPIVLREVERICQRQRINVSFVPRMVGLTDRGAADVTVTSPPEAAKPPFPLPSYVRFKRPIDIIGSLVLLVLLTPLWAVAALLVIIDVGLPVLFWQERVGWHGRSFLIYKFRTLASPFDADGNPLITGREPSTIGRLLRVTRLDELPQLLNVLFGDMSLIGPRPLLPVDQPENSTVRLLVRPGISGWAQIKGGKLVTKEEKEKLDEFYVRNASPWLDLRIVFMTLKYCLRASQAEASADAEQVQLKNAPLNQTVSAAGQSVAKPTVVIGEVHRQAS
jgi:lipopolysaccharide/colanic/teichoic acid biosynthesis glycosyltransferase